MSFEEQFTSSIAYRSQFDQQFHLDVKGSELLMRTFVRTREKSMQQPFLGIRQGISALALDYVADRSIEPYSYQCLADSHVFLRACVDQNYVDEKYMTLTVGDVAYKGERLFNADRAVLHSAVQYGISTQDSPRFHVWLTLADMTIIDLTIVQQLCALSKLDESTVESWLSIWHPDRKGELDYFPILVDDDFLKRLQKPVH